MKQLSSYMTKTVFSILLILLITLSCSSPNYGQGMCHLPTLKVNRLRGRVLVNDQNPEPIPKAKIELKRLDETQSLVTSTLTDNLGFFDLERIEKGGYVLDVSVYYPWLSFTFRIALKFKKASDTKSKSLIVVKLGSGCWDSKASVVK